MTKNLVERYFFPDPTNNNAHDLVALFAKSDVLNGLLTGPRWGRPRSPDLPGLDYQRTSLGIIADSDRPVITRAVL